MSKSHRSPYDTANTSDSGSGCALFLIIAGIAIMIIAGGIMLVAGVFVIGSAESEPVVVEEVVEDVTEAPTPEPTATPAPTATSIPTVIPEASATPDSASEPAPDFLARSDYEMRITEISDSLWPSLDQYFILSASPDPGNEEWRASVEEQFAVWEALTEHVQSIQPPENFQGSHERYLEAGVTFEEAARVLRGAMLGEDSGSLLSGMELLSDALVAFSDATVLMSQERLQ